MHNINNKYSKSYFIKLKKRHKKQYSELKEIY